MTDGLSMWTVYDHPKDFPQHYVARCFIVDAVGVTPTGVVLFANTLEELRAILPRDLYRMRRFEQDDANIVEVWL